MSRPVLEKSLGISRCTLSDGQSRTVYLNVGVPSRIAAAAAMAAALKLTRTPLTRKSESYPKPAIQPAKLDAEGLNAGGEDIVGTH